MAIGNGAQSGQTSNIALGAGAQALANNDAVAIGTNSLADRALTVSIGNKSTGLTRRLVNMDAGGQTTDAVNVSQLLSVLTALGGSAALDQYTGVVTGPTYTLANGGPQTTLSGALDALDKAVSDAGGSDPYVVVNSTGASATATGTDAVAIGSNAVANAALSVALGTNSTGDTANAVSVGNPSLLRKIMYVAAGDVTATSRQAVNGSQLFTTNQTLSDLRSALSSSGLIDPNDPNSTLAITYDTASKTTVTFGSRGQLVELMNVAPALQATDAVNLNQMTIALDNVRSELGDSLPYVKVNSTGADANAAGLDAVAIGSDAIATIEGSAAFGVRARASAAHGVALGSDSLADTVLSVSIGNKPAGLKRRLMNLQAGTDADDAVSVRQLQPIMKALGGNASIDPSTGEVTGPTYTLANGGVQTSLEDALGALDQAVSESGANNPYLAINSTGPDAAALGQESIGLGSGASATGKNAVAIGAHTVAGADNTVSMGSPGSERTIVNVAAGDLSATSTDAVTGMQLNATNLRVGVLENTLDNSGLIDTGTGKLLAVTYTNASQNLIQLGNLNTPVEIMNVADGIAGSDAVTVNQLTGAINGLSSQFSNNLKYVRVNSTGTNANASANDAVAIGSTANATAPATVAIGTGSRASATNSVAIGFNSVTSQSYTVSVGSVGQERKVINVADGDFSAGSTDAATCGQVFAALGMVAGSRSGVFDVTAPLYAIEGLSGDNTASLNGQPLDSGTALAFGVSSGTSGLNTAAFGLNCLALSDNAVAIGTYAQTGAGQDYSVAIGANVQTNGMNAVALGGNDVQANADYALAVGNRATYAIGQGSIAIGSSAKSRTNTVNSIAIGTSANVPNNVTNALALGANTSVTVNGGVALGQGSVANRGNAVSLGNTSSTPITRQIINAAAGTQSTDVVIINQLQGVTNVIGGGAAVGADGSITPPSYTIGGTPYTDVSAALNAVANMAGTDPNAVAYDDTAKDTVTLGGAGGTLLTNVQDGSVAADSLDAINGSQLFGTADSLATNLGGGAAVNADGTVSPPLYVIGPTLANDVGTALGNVVTVVNTKLADAGLVDPSSGQAIAAVTYNGASKNSVTLGGTGATQTVRMNNLAPGSLSDTSTDAVNGSQLSATNQIVDDLTNALQTGGVIDPTSGKSLAVTYVDDTETAVELGTLGTPVTVSNVAPGTQATDGVNISQLEGVTSALGGGAGVDPNGNIVPPSYTVDGTPYPDVGAAINAVAAIAGTDPNAVAYDDAAKDTVTLDGADGTLLTNVQDGSVDATSLDAINGSQLFGTAQSIATGLGGGATVNPDGTVTPPTYAIDGTTANDVGGAITNLYDVINTKLADAGVVDSVTGQALALVAYDDASKDGVTLGGVGSTTPVPLHNIATGTADTDGVNVAQLTTGLSDLVTELVDGTININMKYIKVSSTGTQAGASGVNAVAIGSASSATANNSLAIGTGARASGMNAVAIGTNSVANQPNVFAVGSVGGERKVVNVANGDVSPGSTDAITGDQLSAVYKALNAITRAGGAKGVKDVVDPLAAIEGRSGNNVASLNGGDPESETAAAIGVFSVASGRNAIAVGLRNVAGSDYSVAFGRMAQTGVDHPYSVAVGSEVVTNAPRAVALGTRVQANGEHAVAVGSNETWAIARSAIAMGEGVKVHGDHSIAIGRRARVAANASDALALGAEASVAAGAMGSVALGHGAVADRGNAISIGGGSIGTRQIIHVAKGTEPDDVVTVAQLKEAVAAMMAEIQLLRSQLGARPPAQ
ncbi:hypothetical protein ISP18_04195 [Dyella humi]|uniref:Uncharacterized protein n=2 Tax=Dyella humi TaxID=1770547 RepID=A0ABW8IG76_9GAMM